MRCEVHAHECTCGVRMEARAEVRATAGLCPPAFFSIFSGCFSKFLGGGA